MIDYERLQSAYERETFYSLQLEIGDECQQGCLYCYMNAVEHGENTLSDEQIGRILCDAHALGVAAIEWLGGEPLLRTSIFEHMAFASSLGMRNNVWTGGLPLAEDGILRQTVEWAQDGLISVHVSTVDPDVYQRLHPTRSPDDLAAILDAAEATLDLGYPASQMLNSVTFTGLQTADDMIHTIDYFEHRFGVKTSLNVYHTYLRPGTPAGELERFIPSPDAVARVYARYTRQWGVERLPMNCVNKQYCATTLAVLCDGSVTPCATIREKDAPNLHTDGALFDVATRIRDHLTIKPFRKRENLPQDCQRCKMSEQCFGCRSRAYAAGRGLYGKDPRCFRRA
ncbi:MAG TPA: radical SAM protein [Chloroflexi bacterium]|nr:radical SAM protein [Chloroflexota bacterium]